MNRLFKIALILSTALFLVTSCSIEKRVYRKGYHVVWNTKHSHESKKQEIVKIEKSSLVKDELNEDVVVLATRESDIDHFARKPLLILNKDTCGDVLLLQNADELAVKILEIDEKIIKYKRCDNIDGPIYSINKSKVALIKYANGTKEVVMPETPADISVSDKRGEDKQQGQRKSNGWGLASFICAVSGCILGFPLLLALPFAIISLKEFKKEPNKYDDIWMPKAALIIGIVYYVLGALICLLVGAAVSAYGAGSGIGFLIVAGVFAALAIASGIALNIK